MDNIAPERNSMRNHRLIVCVISLTILLMLMPLQAAEAQNYFEYTLQIRDDGSALWAINQYSAADAPVVSWKDFQQKVFDLVDLAQSTTKRPMYVNENSFQINTTISAESKITEYSFIWINFSIIEGGELAFGDVFQVNDFFGRLFGDAALQLTYPAGYTVESVYPPPYERQDTDYTLKWVRTQDLVDPNTRIVLAAQQGSGDTLTNQYGFAIILGLTVVIIVSGIASYTVKKRKCSIKPSSEPPETPAALVTEEDKILKILKTSGGTLRQSEITERCKFSKAKTSQLLTALEAMGKLTRYKKGRDKIVTLKERVNEE
ncbi:MAG: helix-turn-helix transcriptional regulator [Candidatus Bathyarchaeia archaeon]|jgi:uncharacterized membrane protein